jgi:hypothetical protein
MKRLSTKDPLTPDDVAERLAKSAVRTWTILAECRQDPVLFEAVKASRYEAGALAGLMSELREWVDVIDKHTREGQ